MEVAMEIKRDVYLDRLIVRKHNGLIKVITGIRRSGKSYLLNTLFYRHLIAENIELKCYPIRNIPKVSVFENEKPQSIKLSGLSRVGWYPRAESNRQRCFRRALLYPFNYGDISSFAGPSW